MKPILTALTIALATATGGAGGYVVGASGLNVQKAPPPFVYDEATTLKFCLDRTKALAPEVSIFGALSEAMWVQKIRDTVEAKGMTWEQAHRICEKMTLADLMGETAP